MTAEQRSRFAEQARKEAIEIARLRANPTCYGRWHNARAQGQLAKQIRHTADKLIDAGNVAALTA